MRRPAVIAALAGLVALLLAGLAPTRAHAYPQFQLSTGSLRCTECHFAPAGGGLINDYGRDEAGDTISRGGDGTLLHGLWTPPDWLALGGDARLAGLVHDEGDRQGVETAVFPMQAELYARVETGNFSAYVDVGYGGGARPKDHTLASRFVSREHFVMWRQGPTGWYARAGRFFAPYGLRLPEHTSYIRRFLGFNLLEEPYSASGGYVDDAWELHLTAFVPDFVRSPIGLRGAGVAALYERRIGETAAYGAQTKLAVGDAEKRASAGVIGKLYLSGPEVQLLGEADVVYQTFDKVSSPRGQLAAYAGAAWFPIHGVMAQLAVERWDEDLRVKGVARSAVDLELQWFPTAHVEASLWGRMAMVGTGTDAAPLAKTLLLQLHYYL